MKLEKFSEKIRSPVVVFVEVLVTGKQLSDVTETIKVALSAVTSQESIA